MVVVVTIDAPSEAAKGENFNVSGIVFDEEFPVQYTWVYIYYNGTLIGSDTTDVDGVYLDTVSIDVAGDWDLKAICLSVSSPLHPITITDIPTVTTQAASDRSWLNGTYEATLHGTITDTGGENCEYRGFQWGSSQGGPYPYSASDSDSFGTGSFQKTSTFSGTVYFRAYARNTAGYGYGGELSFTPPPPAYPTNVQASDGTYTDKVRITWTKSSNATGYQVYRNSTPLGWLGDVAVFDDTGAGAPSITGGSTVASDGTYTDCVYMYLSGSGTNNGATHTYKVKARNAYGESAYSGTNTGYRGPGTLNYQWYRSAGDSNASYSSISGATSSTHADYDAPAPTVTPGTATASDGTYVGYVRLDLSGEGTTVGAGRYYKCYLTASGCSAQWSSYNRGYRGVGALTYQWRRSAADSDANYSDIVGGTTDPYNDTGAPGNGDGRWYYCRCSATGAVTQDSTHNRGYRDLLITMIGGPLGWEWGPAVDGVSVVRKTTDDGLTYTWVTLGVGDKIPSGGPLGWEWVVF